MFNGTQHKSTANGVAVIVVVAVTSYWMMCVLQAFFLDFAFFNEDLMWRYLRP